MIRVVYRTGEEDLVTPKFLDILLYLDQVQLFARNDGWVVVGVDPLRGADSPEHEGAERRRHKMTPLPSTPSTAFQMRHLPFWRPGNRRNKTGRRQRRPVFSSFTIYPLTVRAVPAPYGVAARPPPTATGRRR